VTPQAEAARQDGFTYGLEVILDGLQARLSPAVE
jgi:hypothetical protein